MGEFEVRLAGRLAAAGVMAPPEDLVQLHEKYFELLKKWNRTINLTSLGLEPPSDEAIDRLFVEPIAAAERVGVGGELPCKIIDIGSGGGSPAIPFWIQLPGSDLTMVESRSRKCAFLNEAVRQIRPREGRSVESRFENLLVDHAELTGSADIVTVRAVRLDAAARSLISSLLKPSGRVFHFSAALEIFECSTWNVGEKK